MSRTIGAGLLAHMQGTETTLGWGIKITRTDATVVGLINHDRDLTISSQLYQAAPGLDVASLVSSAGFAVDNTEGTILEDGTIFMRADILAGLWDGAAFELFRFNWADVTQGRDVRKVGNFGNLQPKRGAYTVELRGLRQRLQINIINATQPTCRNRLGDALCGINMAAGGRTVTGTLSHVTSQLVVRDSTRAEAVDFFTNGVLEMTSGENAGLSFKVRGHAANGTLTLAVPGVLAFVVGDAYSLTAGCSKRLAEDCVTRFANGVNFNGEPHLPGVDRVTSIVAQ